MRHWTGLLAAAVMLAAVAPVAARLASPRPATEPARTLIDLWVGANERCRGGSGDSPKTMAACEERERYAARLDRLDWCYGRRGQDGAHMAWYRCGPGSYRFGQ